MATIIAEGDKKSKKVIKNVAPANIDSTVEKLYDQGFTRITVQAN